MSVSLSAVKSILAPTLLSEKHNSKSVVIKPPEATSCPATILLFLISFCMVLKTVFT